MADVKWSDNTAFPVQTSISATDEIMGLHSGANTKFQTTIAQTTGAVTSGHLPVYGSDGTQIKDSGVNVDTNKNIYPNNVANSLASTATAAGTTVLTVASAGIQVFTGTTTQTVQLPITSTLTTGFPFYIINTSTGVVTVTSSGGNTVLTLPGNSTGYVSCLLTSGTTAASWYGDATGASTDLFPNGTVTVTGATQTIANGTVYIANGSGTVTFTLPTSVVGSFFAIVGMNGWQLNLANGQIVTIGNQTANGSSSQNWLSSNNNDSVIFQGTAANTWQGISMAGNPVTSGGLNALPVGFLSTVSVTSSSKAMAANTIYWCNNGASLITYTLPTTGLSLANTTRVRVYGDSGQSSGGWKITYGTGVVIRYGQNVSTATTGFIQSTNAGDGIELTYIQGTEWLLSGIIGAPKLDTGGSLIGIATANSAQVVTNSSGVPSMTATMTDAQVVFGNTGSTPAPGSFVAGTGIGFNYSGGNLTISTNGASTNVNPNIIIGGNMDVAPWAAGTSFAAAANDSRIGDRFRWFKSGTGVVTTAKTALAPSVGQSGIFLTNCLSVTVTTADASIGATDLYQIKYAVEGSDWTQVYQQAMTLSFWMQASVTGKYGVSVQNSAGTRCYIAECNYTVGNAWQQFVINIPADSTGVFNITPGSVGAYITWTLAAGSNFQGSTGWQTSGSAIYCTSNQPNDMATNNNVFYITLPYLQPGTFTAPAYPYESQADVLERSQRYYETSQSTEGGFYFPSTDQTGGINTTIGAASTSSYLFYVPYKARKAIVPTLTLCDSAAATGKVFKGANGKTAQVVGSGEYGFNGGTSDATSSNNLYFQFQADAEIF